MILNHLYLSILIIFIFFHFSALRAIAFQNVYQAITVDSYLQIPSINEDYNITLTANSHFGQQVSYIPADNLKSQYWNNSTDFANNDIIIISSPSCCIYLLYCSNAEVDSIKHIKTYSQVFSTELSSDGISDTFGYSVTNGFDMNSDDVYDIIVGAPHDDDGGTDVGAVYFIMFNTNGSVKTYHKVSKTTTEGTQLVTLETSGWFGTSVNDGSDIDNDNVLDVIVGARLENFQSGSVYILFLNTSGGQFIKSYVRINGNEIDATGDQIGLGLSMIGGGGDLDSLSERNDLDQDGNQDLIVGGFADDDGNSNAGSVLIIFLNSDSQLKTYTKISATSGSFTVSFSSVDYFGWGVSSVGNDGKDVDLDGDGIQDIIASAVQGESDVYTDDGTYWISDTGVLYILLLQTNGNVNTYSKIYSSIVENGDLGLNNGDYFGTDIISIGDSNSDGLLEILVGAPYVSDISSEAGAIYMLQLYNPPTPSPTPFLECPNGFYCDNWGTEECIQCLKASWCPSCTIPTCIEGRTGIGCALCDKDYYLFNEECRKCPTSQMANIIVLSVALLFFILIVYKLSTTKLSLTVVTIISEIVSHFQIVGVIFNIPINYPDLLLTLANYIDTFIGLSPIEFASPECTSNFNYWNIWLLQSFSPLFLMLTSCILLLKSKGTALRYFSFIVAIMYIYSIETTSSIFPCSKYNGKYYMDANPDIQCNSSERIGYVILASFLFVGYCFGTMFFYYKAIKRTSETDPVFGWMIRKYNVRSKYWEIVILIHKLIITILSVFLWNNGKLLIFILAILEVIYFFIETYWSPYRNNSKINLEQNTIQTLTFDRLILLILGCLIANNVGDRLALTISIVLIYLFGIIVVFIAIYHLNKIENGILKSLEIEPVINIENNENKVTNMDNKGIFNWWSRKEKKKKNKVLPVKEHKQCEKNQTKLKKRLLNIDKSNSAINSNNSKIKSKEKKPEEKKQITSHTRKWSFKKGSWF